MTNNWLGNQTLEINSESKEIIEHIRMFRELLELYSICSRKLQTDEQRNKIQKKQMKILEMKI